MIFEYNFPFGISQLQIKSAEQISTNLLEDLSVLIETFQFELNHNLINSSAYVLNNTQVGLSAFVRPELIDFIKYSMKVLKQSKSILNPFKNYSTEDPFLSYVISYKDNIVMRKDNIFFNSNLLNKVFIIGKVNQFLLEKRIKSYLLISESIQSSYGNYRWNTHFFIHELNEQINFKLYNQSSILESIEISEQTKPTKFANVGKPLLINKIIIIGDDLTKLKIISNKTSGLRFKFDFEQLKSREGVNLILIDSNNEVIAI